MGGTHWYHPHHHGSTSLQVGGGAAGVFIVEDRPGEVPDAIRTMDERVMLWTVVDTEELVETQQLFNAALWQFNAAAANTGNGGNDHVGTTLLLNGLTRPVVAMESGRWQRWRMVFSAMASSTILSFDDNGGDVTCEMQLLAKDGIYLLTAPRTVTQVSEWVGGWVGIWEKYLPPATLVVVMTFK